MKLTLFVTLLLFISGSFAQTSRNGEFSAHIDMKGGAKDKREHNTWSAKIVDKNGSVQYQLEKAIAFDVQFPAVYLADDGSAIVVSVFDGLAEFYNNRGSLLATRELLGKRTAEHEQVIKCSVSGKRVALLVSSPELPKAELVVMDLAGKELWRVTLNEQNAAEVFLSSDGEYVAVGSYTMKSTLGSITQIFDTNGKQLNAYEMAFRFADISPDGRIALADRNSVRLFRLSGSDPLFDWKTNARDEIVTSVRIVNDHVASVVELVVLDDSKPRYKNPTLVVLNAKGSIAARSALNTSSKNPALLDMTDSSIAISSASSKAVISLTDLK